MVNNKLSAEKDEIQRITKKIIILGEGGVGKTTLIHRYITDKFVHSLKMTIGSNFFTKKVIIKSSKKEIHLNMLILDFAGQKRFREILKDYTRGTHAVILTFDISNPQTLINLEK